MRERDLHDALESYLRKNKLSYRHDRMDKKTTGQNGWPDFTIIHCGRACLIEIKTDKGKLSPAQEKVIAQLRANGTGTVIARSDAEAIAAVESWMGVENAPQQAQESGKMPLKKVPYFGQRRKAPSIETPAGDGNEPKLDCIGVQVERTGLHVGKTEQGQTPFCIAKIGSVEYVMAPDRENNWSRIRVASAVDVLNLPRWQG